MIVPPRHDACQAYLQTAISVSKPKADLPGRPSSSTAVTFSMEANKALADGQTLALFKAVEGGRPSLLGQQMLARQMTATTFEFLKRAFPELNADEALDEALRRLCPESYDHCLRVGGLASRFLRELGLFKAARRARKATRWKESGVLALTLAALDEDEREDLAETLEASGELHDIGKLAIPDEILNKPGPLSEEEFELVKLHPVVGESILDPLETSDNIKATVRSHHERWDGKGYPDGLAGEDIPLEARVIALVDSFDAMTESRPYRSRMSLDEAADEILVQAGKQFDPDLAEIFVGLIRGY